MLNSLSNHLWQSTLFAIAAYGLTLLLRRYPARVRHAIWLAASVKFLVPFSLLISMGSRVEWRPPAVIAPQTLPPAVERISEPFTFIAAAPASATSVLPLVLATLWIASFSAILLRWLVRWLRIRSILISARPVDRQCGVRIVSCASSLEPGIFGVFRPVLALPEGIGSRLSAQQLSAIIAHELCHVRRRDNLWAALHMVVEAVFWFHPLVWWIGARLVEERERACDEEVLRSGSAPQTYAEGILKVCHLYMESRLACASGVTGADLKKRIEEIMSHRSVNNLGFSRKVLLASAAAAAVLSPLAIGLLRAQPQLAFEAASIKPSKPETPDRMRLMPGGGLTAANVNLKWLIEMAYKVQNFQISGGPAWAANEGYDIVTTASGNPTQDQSRLMIRTLLADRFQLQFHRETRDLPIYTLVSAKGGVRSPEVKRDPKPTDGQFGWGPGRIQGEAVTMSEFAELLAKVLHRPVSNQTGVAGRYDLSILYTPEGYVAREGGNSNERRPDANGPSIFTALQEQLGLRLEAGKGPVEIIVIDHAEKPSAN